MCCAPSPCRQFWVSSAPGCFYFVIRHLVHDRHLYEPPRGDTPPAWWVRGLLILTCTSVSFSHGTNDGQKSIGLIMLTIIGLMPAAFALNPNAADQTARLPDYARAATPLIENTATTRSRSADRGAAATTGEAGTSSRRAFTWRRHRPDRGRRRHDG